MAWRLAGLLTTTHNPAQSSRGTSTLRKQKAHQGTKHVHAAHFVCPSAVQRTCAILRTLLSHALALFHRTAPAVTSGRTCGL
eukprot:1674804-Amphidinium_carterae.1